MADIQRNKGRWGNWLLFAWIVSTIATAGSLYMSEILHFLPCSLCWFQRIFMYPLPILLGMAVFKEQPGIAAYALPFPVIGGLFSIYHIVLQKLPHGSDLAAACGPVSCQGDYLNWFGWITIPMLALTAFVLIFIALWRVSKLGRANG